VNLRPACPDDFGYVRGLTQHPDYMPFISDDDEAALAAHLANPAHRLLIWQGDQGPAGFALFCEIGDPSGRIELRRLALAQTGGGAGAAFLAALMAYAFDDLGAARLWLDASGENPRAQAVYARAGFALEGRLRQHWHRPSLGRSVDVMLYGILRDEWAAL
jgi:RimJ/RimL family protein N-acetyltransferase